MNAGERFIENTSVEAHLNYFCFILSNYSKPSVSTLGQPLRMAAHTSDWGDPSN
jgi:hypothetical protein